MISGFNNVIACEPFKSQTVETKVVGNEVRHLRTITNKGYLVPLRVVYGSVEHKIARDDLVYVVQPGPNDSWAKTVEVQVGGEKVEVVIVTLDRVQLVDRQPVSVPPRPAPTATPRPAPGMPVTP